MDMVFFKESLTRYLNFAALNNNYNIEPFIFL